MTKVSVIIPSYRPKEYFWDCLNSLVVQTLEKDSYEVVVVLNGCDEPYSNSIITFINNNPNTHILFKQTNESGVSNARNIGIDIAEGEYITFLDDDDYVSPTYLEDMLARTSPNCWPISNIVAFKDGTNVTLPYGISNQFQRIKHKNKVPLLSARSFMSNPVGKLIKRSDIGNIRFNRRFKSGEDSLFVFAISRYVKYLRPTEERAIYYRRYREGSAITTSTSLLQQLKNTFRINAEYGKIYSQAPFSYNFFFFLSRLLAGFKSIYAKRKLNAKLMSYH